MGRIQKLFKALSLITKKPSLLNRVLDDNDEWRRRVNSKYNFPKGLPEVNILDLVPGGNEKVSPYSFLDGTSRITDLALLRSLAKKYHPCSYLEIGTWRGESVANVAAMADHCVTINFPDEEMLRMGKSREYVNLHRFFSQKLDNVQHIQHDSRTFDYASLNKKFDLVFVDGDHHYENVKKDTQNIFGLRQSDNSVIVWHDYAFAPGLPRWEVLNGILDALPAAEHRHLYYITTTLCCLYSKQPLRASLPAENRMPAHYFEITISSKPV